MNVFGKNLRVSGQLIKIARLAAEGFEYFDDPMAAVENMQKIGQRIDIFTFIQNLVDTTVKYRYPMERDNMAALPVTSFDNWWKCQITDKTRNMARRAEKKGVCVREVPFDDALVRGIQAIYNETPIRQGKAFWHYGKDLETVRRENVTFAGRSAFIGAYLNEDLIGFCKLTFDEHNVQAGLMQIVSMIQHRDKAPTNALIAQAVRSCAVRQIRYLIYGKIAYGNKGEDGLSDFKHYNGFQREEIPRYYVPLTLVGRVALKLGLHHAVSDRVPRVLLAQFQRARTRWYGLTTGRVKESI
jgi:hypothetical protein